MIAKAHKYVAGDSIIVLTDMLYSSQGQHLAFRSINRWTLGRMIISTAREKTPMDIPLLLNPVTSLGTQQHHGGNRNRTLWSFPISRGKFN